MSLFLKTQHFNIDQCIPLSKIVSCMWYGTLHDQILSDVCFLAKGSCSCREEGGVASKSLRCKESVRKTEKNSENLVPYALLFHFLYLFILELRVFHCSQCKCYLSYMCGLCILFYGFLRSTAQITEPHGTVGHQSHFLQPGAF